MSVHEAQADKAKTAILASGGMLMRTPIWLQQALCEDTNIYDVCVLDRRNGPGVALSVNGWGVDYWPQLTRKRAERLAQHLVEITPYSPSAQETTNA